MRDHHTTEAEARGLLERQLANYLKTAACLTGVTRERVEMLAELVRQEIAEQQEEARIAASRRTAWGPRAPWQSGERTALPNRPRKAAAGSIGVAGPTPHASRGRARGVA